MATYINEPSHTFNEYLLIPGYSSCEHIPSNVSLKTPLVRYRKGEKPEIEMQIPMVSAIMQSVSGPELALALAKCGGVSFIYGTCGTLYFNELASHVDGSLVQILALACFIAGMGFKISLVPFHLWTADTYEGAPTVVTGYLSVVSKSSAAFVLLIVLMKVFAPMVESWDVVLFWITVASITLANIFAVRQKNLKRFMAFSAISQAGYVILGVMSGTAQGMTALVFYLLVYMVANLGAFAVLNVVEQHSGKIGMDDYNGLYSTNPRLAFLMTLCLFSLAGIPPFAGFFSKIFVFMAAFNAGHHLLVFIALVNTVISLYYYLLIVKAMYIKPNEALIATFRSDNYTRVGLFVCLLGVFVLGFVGVYNYLSTLSYGI